MKKNNCLKHKFILLLATILLLLYLFCAFALFDPTKPKDKMKTNKNVTLDMIQYNNRHSVAYINGVPVAVGDDFFGMKVVAITRNSVTLRNRMEVKVLKLFKDD